MQGAIFEVKFEPVCCKKRPKIVPDQLLVWGIICTFKLNLLHKKELTFADFDLIGLPFQAVVVFTLGCDFLFKSILGHCGTTVADTKRSYSTASVSQEKYVRFSLKFS